MKVVDFKTFAAMPKGTIFSYYKPIDTDGLFVKGGTFYRDRGEREPIDYDEMSLIAEPEDLEEPVRLSVAHHYYGWGLFKYDQQYAIYEEEDLAELIRWLKGEGEWDD